ncbi:MAG: hypothetical protein IPI67_28275 [Myxococcales bacterium]|nr:hypothetical protein [Myxococcales bacterium]
MGRPVRNRTELALAAFIVSLLLTCKGYEELEPDDICQETGFSIANRTVTCTDDTELGNARYEKFRDQYRCIAQLDTGSGFQCAISLRKLSCTDVKQFGDDLDAWLAAGIDCATIVENKSKTTDAGLE